MSNSGESSVMFSLDTLRKENDAFQIREEVSKEEDRVMNVVMALSDRCGQLSDSLAGYAPPEEPSIPVYVGEDEYEIPPKEQVYKMHKCHCSGAVVQAVAIACVLSALAILYTYAATKADTESRYDSTMEACHRSELEAARLRKELAAVKEAEVRQEEVPVTKPANLGAGQTPTHNTAKVKSRRTVAPVVKKLCDCAPGDPLCDCL